MGLNKPKVSVIENIKKELCSWGKDAILFQVKNGLGQIKSNYYSKDNVVNKQLCVNGKSLYTLNSDNYFCPTCQKMIEEGYGFEDKDRVITNKIIAAQDTKLSIEESLELLDDFMKLFSDGLYMISRFDVYPTDGEGECFWTSTKVNRYYEVTADLYYKFHVGGTTLKYLYPSQPLSKFDKECFDQYCKNKSTSYSGFVYSMDGSIGLILDGHHRALAACINHEKVHCLGVARIEGYALRKEGIESLWAFGQSFKLDDFQNKKLVQSLLPKDRDSNRITTYTENIPSISDTVIDKKILQQLDSCAKEYPKYRELAFEYIIQEKSFERLEYLWNQYDEESEFEFEILLGYLFRLDKEKCYDYIVKVIFDEGKTQFHEMGYRLLLTYPEDVIEDILINYLVEVEYDKSDSIRILIDDYFRTEM